MSDTREFEREKITAEWTGGVSEEEHKALRIQLHEAMLLLAEARDHLEYCGYGDRWERECAREAELPQRLDAYISAYTGFGDE